MKLVIVSGLSGSGKSVALHMLEDVGYYCIDNIPAALLKSLVNETLLSKEPAYQNMAVGIDARNRPEEIAAVPEVVGELRQAGISCEIVFLVADDEVLLKRYSETRRRHPLSTPRVPLREAIHKERELLAPVAEHADLILDTTRTSVHELRDLIRERVHELQGAALSLLFRSFGYRHGLPGDADFIFDVRCLPNPHWEPQLRSLTGLDQPVIEYLEKEEDVQRMFADIRQFLERWIPEFKAGNRSYMTVAIGCTGGYHRSVYLAEKLAAHFGREREHVLVRHNELK